MGNPICEVCKKNKSLGVASSPLGAISHAYCGECLHAGRQPWPTLVGGLYGCRQNHVAEWVLPIIKATCEFFGKTEDELWQEVAQLEKDYEEYLRGETESGE